MSNNRLAAMHNLLLAFSVMGMTTEALGLGIWNLVQRWW